MDLISKNDKLIRKGISYETNGESRYLKFTAPASIKGIGFLSLPVDLTYIPAIIQESDESSNIGKK